MLIIFLPHDLLKSICQNPFKFHVRKECIMTNMKDLQAQAKLLGLTGYSKMKKEDLLLAIQARQTELLDGKKGIILQLKKKLKKCNRFFSRNDLAIARRYKAKIERLAQRNNIPFAVIGQLIA